VPFIASLADDKKLSFKVACMPHADKFQLHIYAVLAEQERDCISKQAKAALRAVRKRGVLLGSLRGDKQEKANARKKRSGPCQGGEASGRAQAVDGPSTQEVRSRLSRSRMLRRLRE